MIKPRTRRRSTVKQGHPVSQGVLPCPACQSPIPLKLTDLLVAKPVWCSSCGGCLHLSQASSAPALGLWNRLERRLQELGPQAGA